MIFIIAGKVILNGYVFEHPVIADNFPQFIALIRAVQTGGHQNTDIFPVQAGCQEVFNQKRQNDSIGHRPGDVTYQNAGSLLAPDQFRNRRATDRIGQGAGKGIRRIIQQRHGLLFNQYGIPVIRNIELKVFPAVVHC